MVILSDTFYQFSAPLMQQLGWPTLLCHTLVVDKTGTVTDYALRQPDAKRQCVKAFKGYCQVKRNWVDRSPICPVHDGTRAHHLGGRSASFALT